ncbi:eukaryotic translation initiation factor 4E [Novymonas esmeraldas]|uniref:Eukaryotic translation initiation factor 4E n=1 Tax=Novymonas esmeraldas TaxID=1808958 RepID=A0AAW0F5R4_9TRYP
MNPKAAEFVPGQRNGGGGGGGDGGGGLEALPTSTADMELAKAPSRAAAVAADAAAGASVTSTTQMRSPAIAPLRSVHTSPSLQASRFGAKSATEIMAIGMGSGLSANAHAYVPQRTLTRVALAQPSPLTIVPSENPATDGVELMMLDDLWCLFYLPTSLGENISEADYNPTLVFRIESIPTFWKVLNNIAPPSKMRLSTLFLFRDGIAPKWEDALNREGGIVRVTVTSAQVDEAWELLLCRSIGDSWAPTVRETVNGVVLKVRERAYRLEVWVTKDSTALQKDLANLWHPVLGGSFATTYMPHAAMQECLHAAAAVAAEKQHKQRRRY